jgi:hypothetical protein
MKDFFPSFIEFVNEARVVVKRQYTSSHPEKAVSDYAPVRERILSFINEKGTVTRTQLLEFIRGLNETTGRTTSAGWINKNSNYFNVKEANGTKYYSLSKLGERVHTSIMQQKSI